MPIKSNNFIAFLFWFEKFDKKNFEMKYRRKRIMAINQMQTNA